MKGWLIVFLSVFAGLSMVLSAVPPADSVALVEGLRLYEAEHYEQARERLLVSAASADSEVRAESFLYLNALEMELGNWDAARPWLEKYHAEITRQSVERAVAQVNRRHNTIIGVICGVLLLGLGAFLLRHRVRTKPRVKMAEYEQFRAEAEAFRRTEIYSEIVALASQGERGREAKVLSLARQEVLNGELKRVFAGFRERLRHDFPALTVGDVNFCCLSLAGLSTFARALCFGSTETNIVKQRKHKIKAKMNPATFAFVFE